MNRDEMLALVSDVLAGELTILRDELETRIDRRVDGKALPPFVPPKAWTEGRHGAGVSVRHRNGLFVARRDTETEPGRDDGAWLPLVVGIAGLDLRWTGERDVAFRAALSDGTVYELTRHIPVPIVRGYWSADADYDIGDRVFRFGEFHAQQPSKGVEPGTPGSETAWLKVGGKNARSTLALSIDDEGEISEGGRVVGSIKPLVARLLDELVKRHGNGPGP
jgi:hypothetical protein